MLATLLNRYRISSDDPRPVLPVARVTIEPSFAPMFRLEKICLDPGKPHAHARRAIDHNATRR